MKSWPGDLLCLAVFPCYHTDINLAVYFLSKPEPELQLNCINVQTWASLFFFFILRWSHGGVFVYCANEKPVSLKLVLVKSEIVSFVVVDNDKEQSVRSAYIKRLLITVKKREGGGATNKEMTDVQH